MKLHPGTDYTVIPTSLLNDALEYFEAREDASNEGDGWQGNEAMHLASLLREALAHSSVRSSGETTETGSTS